eukprot:scaffold348640_cov51-Prasinocladus_malaysianus.AAC.1
MVHPHPQLTTKEFDYLLERNTLDAALYMHAKQKWEKVEERGGSRLAAAVAELQRQQTLLADYCQSKVYHSDASTSGDWVSNPGCIWLTLEATEYE